MKIYVMTCNGVYYGAYTSDELAWTEQDRLRTTMPQHKWEVFGSMVEGR